MCGIAGYIALQKESNWDTDSSLLNSISRKLQHRGPDDSGHWVDDRTRVAFVHRRLSILDISSAGAQPKFDQDHTVVVIYNGEIYNFHAIRYELISYGYSFHSESDTEVLIYAYKHWGIAALSKFEGDFAIALYDLVADECYLVRDRIGVKPLYFSFMNGICSFASELKALWVMPWVDRERDARSVSHYLSFLTTPAPCTMYRNVYKLPPGFYLKINKERNYSFHQWYDVPFSQTNDTFENAKDRVHDLLVDSVHQRLIADVPVGIFLSGGVDSSIITAIAARHTPHIQTFNVSFSDEPEEHERSWARLVAQHCGTNHHEIVIDQQDAFDTFLYLSHIHDEPLGDTVSIPLLHVSRIAREKGIRAVLVGEGSDELANGYSLYQDYHNLNRYWHKSQHYIPQSMRQLSAHLLSVWYGYDRTKTDIAYVWANNQAAFYSSALVFSRTSKEKSVIIAACDHTQDPIIKAIYPEMGCLCDSYDLINYHRNRFYARYPSASYSQEIMYLEFKHRLPDLILARTDAITMAASIEARVPFLDSNFIAYMASLPRSYTYAGGITKYILKQAFSDYLPDSIFSRKKMGFASPCKRWFEKQSLFTTFLMDTIKKSGVETYIPAHRIENMVHATQSNEHDYSAHLWALATLYMHAAS